jgi:glycosyltransferase involved in cell wall biosynthesis
MNARRVLFLSTYPPRECGIATFTKSLGDALSRKFGDEIRPGVVAMEEEEQAFRKYGPKVVLKINENSLSGYESAAEEINSMKGIDVINIQHEFGIFGGRDGEKLISLMEKLDKKVVTTFHTMLEDPDRHMLKVVRRIAETSEKIVVMTQKARQILCDDYQVDEGHIMVIPHGVPNVNIATDSEKIKKKFGLSGSKILLTFGLLSRGKALETVIEAMPEVLKRHPETFYFIVGETHPRVKELEGESYRNELKKLAAELGVSERVKFMDRYLKLGEIIDCLTMADVYLAPSEDERQICSGTVSYAMAAGKAIISSINRYNEEVLADGRGIIVENCHERFSAETNRLLDDSELRNGYERRAFEYSRNMTWQNVSTRYFTLFNELGCFKTSYFGRLPRINFSHMDKMTDDFGIIQFAEYSNPVKESGYTLDDNARALSVTIKAFANTCSKKMLKMADTYLSFLENAQTPQGDFHNYADENMVFSDYCKSEDSFGRAMHTIGSVFESTLPRTYKYRAKKILEKSLSHQMNITSPRAQADSLIGLSKAKETLSSVNVSIRYLIESLLSKFENNTDGDWQWFEPYLTYGNSILPEALFVVQRLDRTKRAAKVAAASLDFLTRTHFMDGILVPVGQEGWFIKNGRKAVYDQQPIEAATMTTAYLKAFEATGNSKYTKNARKAFDWFLGRNTIKQMVYDESTGGCFDGITRTGVNLNQGAESTISYLNARLSINQTACSPVN